MHTQRDLFVLLPQHLLSRRALDILHQIIFETESKESFARAHEVINLNRRKIFTDAAVVKKIMRVSGFNKSFVFFFNKN